MADRTTGLRLRADDKSITSVETEVLTYYHKEGWLTEDEIKKIVSARQIRNPLLHGEFSKAFDRIEKAANLKIPHSSALALKVGTRKGEEILNLLVDAPTRGSDAPDVEPLRTSSKNPELFRRLLDLSISGALRITYALFHETNKIIDRVTEESARKNTE